MNSDLVARTAQAVEIVEAAGRIGMNHFLRRDSLGIELKGHLDFVSEADREVEVAIRDALAASFPEDSIVGEEHAPAQGSSGFTWVIDPIDGTANFVAGIPVWCVVLAGVEEGRTVVAAIHDPNSGETFSAWRGGGARLNGSPLHLAKQPGIGAGTVGVGASNRSTRAGILSVIGAILSEEGRFFRNASGALALAYVAAGRLIGYVEQHMNAWDCLAGQLLVEEAGGSVELQDADLMIAEGGRVVVGAPGVFAALVRIADAAYA